jgi:hypothetical protein
MPAEKSPDEVLAARRVPTPVVGENEERRASGSRPILGPIALSVLSWLPGHSAASLAAFLSRRRH